jgi:DNA-binding NtrC family response regulator
LRTETEADSAETTPPDAAACPGLLLVYAGGRPAHLPLPLADGARVLGRDELAAMGVPDKRVSRRHLRVELAGGRWSVRDLGSRNGTFVDGHPCDHAVDLVEPVIRMGRTLILPVGDIRPHVAPGLAVRDGVVMGPALAAAHRRIVLVAKSGGSLLVNGGSGSGKELAAQAFHAATGSGRALIAVNCATIQRELAERVLFGARRGAYTGAVADTTGLVQAADGGTLFLDEIAELDLVVQAKLLRVLETKRVTALGAVSPTPVDMRLCAATHKDLRAEVAEGRFREDLFFRIGRPHVRLPSLPDRRDEIPWLVEHALTAPPVDGATTATAELMEACLVRRWPGNVRELLAEVRIAALAAASDGRTAVTAADLDAEAGRTFRAALTTARVAPAEPSGGAVPSSPPPHEIEAALRAERGNVARAAARLGVPRIRVRRFVEREGIDLRAFRS